MEGKDFNEKLEVYSSSVRAGKRTYFFDVKKTKKGDLYLTITESKKVFHSDDGSFHFEKHKLFLYKEDFEKFTDALEDALKFIKENAGSFMEKEETTETEEQEGVSSVGDETTDFIKIKFEDLNKEE